MTHVFVSRNLLVHSGLGGGCFREIRVVALSITFLAALIISHYFFIVSYLLHRPRLALIICHLHLVCSIVSFFSHCPVTPVTYCLVTSRELDFTSYIAGELILIVS